MKECNRLLKSLKKGNFENCLNCVSEDMLAHIEECQSCHKQFLDLTETEKMLQNSSSTKLSKRAKARIRMNVNQSIMSATPSRFRAPALWWGLPGLAVVVIVMLLIPNLDHQREEPEVFIVNQLDDNLVEEMLGLLEPGVYEYDDTDIKNAVVIKSDTTFFNVLLENWYDSEFDYYKEYNLSMFSEFDEDDWEMLRRYLI